jgi:hypothetical protein
MGRYLLAELVERDTDKLRYWVCNGSRHEEGEFAILFPTDIDHSYTEGFESLQADSAIMMARVVRHYRDTGEWPSRKLLQS